MSATTIRVSKKTHTALRRLAVKQGMTMHEVIDSMLEQFRREQFLQEVNRGFEALRKNPKAWKQEVRERSLLESALMDGLEDD